MSTISSAPVAVATNNAPAIRTPWREFWRKFKKQHVAVVALVFVRRRRRD